MKLFVGIVIVAFGVVTVSRAAPGGAASGAIAASASSSGGGGAFGIPFLTFKDGNFGVNFGGYHAEAGLGGLLTGNAAHGGLHASAGTPTGQAAAAGLGGKVDGGALTGGGLYAGATAGNNVGARAGLGGVLSGSGYGIGTKYAGASAGGSVATKHVYTETQPAVVVKEIPTTYVTKEVVQVPVHPVVVHKTKIKTKVHGHHHPHVHHSIRKYVYDVAPVAPATLSAGAAIGGSVDVVPGVIKEVHVVEKQPIETVVRVESAEAAAPAVISNEVYESQQPPVVKPAVLSVSGSGSASSSSASTGTAAVGGAASSSASASASASSSASATSVGTGSGGIGGSLGAGASVGGSAVGVGHGGYGHSGSVGVTYVRQHDANFFRNIFNIPIATLGAVSNLVSGIAGNKQISVSKSYSGSVAV